MARTIAYQRRILKKEEVVRKTSPGKHGIPDPCASPAISPMPAYSNIFGIGLLSGEMCFQQCYLIPLKTPNKIEILYPEEGTYHADSIGLLTCIIIKAAPIAYRQCGQAI
jgi:hypothetical protein